MRTLAISILNWNNINDTINCINSLKISKFQDFDIYLLDNWSSNSEFEKIKNTYLNENFIILNNSDTNLWFTWWNNFNIDLILKKDYKYILLLNNDTIIPNNFLWDFIEKIWKISDGWVFWPEIRNPDNSIQSIWNKINLYTWSSKRYKIYDKNNIIDYISGSCFFIKKDLINQIWKLDDNFFAYYEESDFCLRTKKSWYSINIINKWYIYHKEETANKKDKPYYCYLMFRNRILFLKKHSNYLQYISSYIFLIWYLIILFPLSFWFKNYKYAFIWIIHWIKWIWWNVKI